MYVFVALAAVLACVAAFPSQDARIDPDADWRIVGGQTAALGQFPYIVSLRRPTSHSCGGSILNQVWILTAAHCVTGASTGNLFVVVGTNTLNSGGVRHATNRIVIHANYNPNNLANDIAVVRVSSPISYNTRVQPISLGTTNVGGGVSCVLSGWGRTSFPGNIPNNLQFLNLLTVTNAVCADRQRPNPIFTSNICTFTRRGEGACQGDSGGPLVQNSNRAQIGVVSWGRPCGIGFPDVYARVSSYISWIQNAAR